MATAVCVCSILATISSSNTLKLSTVGGSAGTYITHCTVIGLFASSWLCQRRWNRFPRNKEQQWSWYYCPLQQLGDEVLRNNMTEFIRMPCLDVEMAHSLGLTVA
ncbi:hypothetical protein FB451DRAFT_1251272 [Mycena latifolia]|nr:hypothetical protein FB451DRAFT_1251272 [Mycena latifolia]